MAKSSTHTAPMDRMPSEQPRLPQGESGTRSRDASGAVVALARDLFLGLVATYQDSRTPEHMAREALNKAVAFWTVAANYQPNPTEGHP